MNNLDITKQNLITDNLHGMGDIYEKLDLHVTINGGLTIKQLINTIEFHDFTADSLTYLLNQINKYRCTYRGIGPFIFRDGGWYNIREKKMDVIKKLTDENKRLKQQNKEIINQTPNKLNQEIERLNKELSHLKEVLDWKEDILTC